MMSLIFITAMSMADLGVIVEIVETHPRMDIKHDGIMYGREKIEICGDPHYNIDCTISHDMINVVDAKCVEFLPEQNSSGTVIIVQNVQYVTSDDKKIFEGHYMTIVTLKDKIWSRRLCIYADHDDHHDRSRKNMAADFAIAIMISGVLLLCVWRIKRGDTYQRPQGPEQIDFTLDYDACLEKKDIISEDDIREEAHCPVCIDDFEIGDEYEELVCGHKYHHDCIHPWLTANYTCPMCKHDYRKEQMNAADENV